MANYDAVRKEIASILKHEDYDDGSLGPVFVRLAWHASGTYDKNSKTGGSNGATMRYAPESTDGANNGLDLARAFLHAISAKYPQISVGDLWTLAGVVAVEEMGGPKVPWKSGRVDVKKETVAVRPQVVPPNGRLPDATQGAQHLRDVFYRMGFNDREIVALSGAHALGRCHKERSGFDGPWTNTPTRFSNLYFKLLLNETWTPKKWDGPLQYEDSTGELMMLPTDMALTKDPEFMKVVKLYADDKEAFFKDFSAAFARLIELGVTRTGKL
ncbi:hypothetical protein SmJEL517_g03163 [Synchytrium microbalum]|uniref:Peroxidase n=1 Tax=Synchytrium microbalum TaxID=1806994 RepID=A0A507BXP3_9FUNG|nr:uncharacterized protein SmJEL517_g03163 [Synchytrium microbalum]TPX34090.1 hypothetical protein SmJEL517_g03163 [Synchytrium microbalum]